MSKQFPTTIRVASACSIVTDRKVSSDHQDWAKSYYTLAPHNRFLRLDR
jgi:hypothetical protein